MEESFVAVLGKHILDKSFISGKVSNYDDDRFDRLNHLYTTTLIGLCVTFMFTRQVVGKPITCWLPSEFSDSQVLYAEQVCWIMSTYYVKVDENIPFYIFRGTYQLHYYQWFPFILIGQAGLYIVPYFLWGICNKHFRRDIINSLESLTGLDINTPEKERSEKLTMARRHFLRVLLLSRTSSSTKSTTAAGNARGRAFINGTYCRENFYNMRGFQMTLKYLLCKCLYIFNCVIQIVLMSRYLQIHDVFHGMKMLLNLINSQYWISESNFPRITYCDFEVMAIGQNLRYTSQCVLTINMFNEKIYLFLWLWNVFLILANFYSFLLWCYRSGSATYRDRFVTRLLVGERYNPNINFEKITNERKNKFINVLLHQDGVFLLQIIQTNLGEFKARAFVQYLWSRYRFKLGTATNVGGRTTLGVPPQYPTTRLTMHDLERGTSSTSFNEVIRQTAAKQKPSTFTTSKL